VERERRRSRTKRYAAIGAIALGVLIVTAGISVFAYAKHIEKTMQKTIYKQEKVIAQLEKAKPMEPYNMLLVGSNAGESAPPSLPIIPFVHWHPIDAEKYPHPAFKPMSAANYQELLWHLLLRGADTFYLWCGEPEYPEEVRLLHEVYAAAQEYGEFLDKAVPVSFSVPKTPAPAVSALRLGDRLLVRRTDFGRAKGPVTIDVAGKRIMIPESPGRCQIIKVN
jgi:hypothetical protein